MKDLQANVISSRVLDERTIADMCEAQWFNAQLISLN